MSGLDVNQSALLPAGANASSIHSLWTLMLWVTVTVLIAVFIALGFALIRGVRHNVRTDIEPPSERTLTRSVGTAVGVTVVILLSLLTASVSTGHAVAAPHATRAVTVAITGHQWWWEIRYEDAVPSRQVLTANELHIPLRRPVVFKVTSRDVIHSVWIPNLQGKRDLIPGYTTAIWLQADRRGIFRGQCAEFCGMQHAHMALDVVVESDEEFEHWLDAMRQSAPVPEADTARRGHDVFMHSRCAGCHTIHGTDAAGQAAPDLTHIATRTTVGAGTLPNTPENLARWIRDPQLLKPGNQMPANPLSDDDLQAVVQYLETLR